MILILDVVVTTIFVLVMLWLCNYRFEQLEQQHGEFDERLRNVEYYQTAMRYEISYLMEQEELKKAAQGGGEQ